MEFSLVPSILIILEVAEVHTFFNSEKGRWSIFMLFTQQNRVEMQARKLITYHGLTSTLCNHVWLPSVARLQRQEGSWTNEKLEKLVHFLQESTGAWHPLLNFANDLILQITRQSSQSTRNSASFETLAKFLANLITFYFRNLSTMALRSIRSGMLNIHPSPSHV
jgi:hypothetical protein